MASYSAAMHSGSMEAMSTEPARSGVSWGAIFVGASAAAALSLLLFILGFGLGMSAISPWSNNGASAQTMGISAAVWVAFTQLAASALGGYLAGRLRVKWASVHTDEVYFRDTAHGFMAWAVATLLTAAFFGSTLSAIVGTGVQAGANLAGSATGAATTVASKVGIGDQSPASQGGTQSGAAQGSSPVDYFVDSLFRKDAAHAGTPTPPATRAEAARIFAADLRAGTMSDEDRQYLGGVVAQETGTAPADAEKRVADKFNDTKAAMDKAVNEAKQAAETARKAAAHSSLWMFVALMLGAFFASLAAVYGGRQRDLVS